MVIVEKSLLGVRKSGSREVRFPRQWMEEEEE